MTKQRNFMRREKVKENSDGNDTNVGSIGNSIEEAIERLEYIDRAYSYNNYYSVWDLKCIEILLSDYKRVLKENERYKKSDYETICLENNELREITDRIQSEYNDLLKDNFKLKNELETKRKEYQETYKDVREELKELRKENEELKNKLSLKQFDVNIVYNDYLEKLNEYERNNIPKQKVKDKIEHYQKLQHNYIEKYDEINEGLQAMISALQELLESEE